LIETPSERKRKIDEKAFKKALFWHLKVYFFEWKHNECSLILESCKKRFESY